MSSRMRIPKAACFRALLAVGTLVLGGMNVSSAEAVLENYANRTDPGPPRMLAPPGSSSLLAVLGSGSPLPNPYRRGPATAVIVNDTPYLFDAGEGIWRGLAWAASAHGGAVARAFQVNKLKTMFLTHLHPDHTVGIPALLYQSWYLGRNVPIEVYGPVGTTRRLEMITEAWRDIIDFDLKYDPWQAALPHGWKSRGHDLDIQTSKVVYKDANVTVEAFHHKHFLLPHNYAYRVTTPDRVIAIGGDGAGDDRLIAAAKDADVFIMEAVTEADIKNAPWGGDTLEAKKEMIFSYHVRPKDLARIASAARVKTLVLYHVQNFSDPFDPDAVLKEVQALYPGTVFQARDGDIF